MSICIDVFQNLVTTGKGITVANGYQTNVKSVDWGWKLLSDINESECPHILIVTYDLMPAEPARVHGAKTGIKLKATTRGIIKGVEAKNDIFWFREDIESAYLVDPGRGLGTIMDTLWRGSTFHIFADHAWVDVLWELFWREAKG